MKTKTTVMMRAAGGALHEAASAHDRIAAKLAISSEASPAGRILVSGLVYLFDGIGNALITAADAGDKYEPASTGASVNVNYRHYPGSDEAVAAIVGASNGMHAAAVAARSLAEAKGKKQP